MLAQAIDGDREREQEFHCGHPIGRIGEPEEVADVALWLCSSRASCVVGTSTLVAGGDLI